METLELKQELKNTALNYGLCIGWQKMFDDVKDKDTLVQMYVRGIDFCFSNNYPTSGYIEQNFKGICEKYGVYVNEQAELTNCRKVVFVGECSGKLKYNSYEVAQVFVKDSSTIEIEATDHAIVTVDCFDNAVIKANATNQAKIIINRYIGAEVSTKSDETGIVKVVEHRCKTYE